MQYIVSVTSKGQATIPAPIRKKLGIKPGEKVVFKQKENEEVVVEKVVSLEELKGSLKSDKKFNDRQADQVIANMFRKEYGKTD